METKVYQGQSFIDKVIESTGSIENVFAMALENNVSITDSFEIGTKLIYTGPTIKSIASVFNKKIPATAINQDQQIVLLPELGIGTMTIGTTFIVG